MTLRLSAVTFDVPDARETARFWAELLDREVLERDGGLLVPGDATQVGLRFVEDSSPRVDGSRSIHLHVTSDDAPSQQHVVDRAVALGAQHRDIGQLPEEDHVVLVDPGGNAFCVIEPGNSYLAGTGRLGEVACDGPRSVGLFWSEALGWPLVWDTDGETAVQSPGGGTKVAWGGTPVEPIVGRMRQRFDLTAPADELDAAVARLVDLGAARLGAASGEVTLADPDGNEFRLVAVAP